MITKTLIVVNGLTGQETPVRVEEGSMPADILNKLNLPDYQLAKVKNRQVLPENCDVSRVVDDRERLFAFAPMVVGCGL
jgi:sulfur carrier protein ThiS